MGKILKTDGTDFENLLLKSQVNLGDEINRPIPVIIQKTPTESLVIGSLGNFSLITGKPKCGKSFLVNILASTCLKKSTNLNHFQNHLPEDKFKVLLFDTEQHKSEVHSSLELISKQDTNIDNLSVHSLRPISTIDRIGVIEYAIENTENLGLVIIDGIRDLVCSINDEHEANKISNLLLKWTNQYNIHIITVLHQNKGNNSVRGHLGTELTNKAEITLDVSSPPYSNQSTVTPTYCRHKAISSFSYMRNELNMPCNLQLEKFKNLNKKQPGISENLIKELLVECFKDQKTLVYNSLIEFFKEAFDERNVSLGANKIKDIIKESRENKWIKQEKVRGPYCLGDINLQ